MGGKLRRKWGTIRIWALPQGGKAKIIWGGEYRGRKVPGHATWPGLEASALRLGQTFPREQLTRKGRSKN